MSGPVLLVIRLLLVIGLYAFLGWALLTIWRDLKRQNEVLLARQVPPITLLRKIEQEWIPFHFASPEILIGRDPLCDCQLDDKTVSAEHARFSYHHSQWWIEDMHSRNGTYLNQEAVSSPVVVTSGDELRFGQIAFTVEIGGKQEAESLLAQLRSPLG
jgi:hypothetical protein